MSWDYYVSTFTTALTTPVWTKLWKTILGADNLGYIYFFLYFFAGGRSTTTSFSFRNDRADQAQNTWAWVWYTYF